MNALRKIGKIIILIPLFFILTGCTGDNTNYSPAYQKIQQPLQIEQSANTSVAEKKLNIEQIKKEELSNDNYYINSKGNTVHSPAFSETKPSGATAKCKDGTYSFSQSRRGTCSHHGGVLIWY